MSSHLQTSSSDLVGNASKFLAGHVLLAEVATGPLSEGVEKYSRHPGPIGEVSLVQ